MEEEFIANARKRLEKVVPDSCLLAGCLRLESIAGAVPSHQAHGPGDRRFLVRRPPPCLCPPARP
ncbi:MAG: hypothetical protein ACPIOQ_28375 [Promethearchaeia archaeon]